MKRRQFLAAPLLLVVPAAVAAQPRATGRSVWRFNHHLGVVDGQLVSVPGAYRADCCCRACNKRRGDPPGIVPLDGEWK